jgi:hypothetical protein
MGLWYLALYCILSGTRCYRKTWYFIFNIKIISALTMETTCYSETLISIYNTRRSHNSEDPNLNSHWIENLKTYKLKIEEAGVLACSHRVVRREPAVSEKHTASVFTVETWMRYISQNCKFFVLRCIFLWTHSQGFCTVAQYAILWPLCRVSEEERSIFWEVIVSFILSKKVYMYMCPIPNGFRDSAISLYRSKFFGKREILRTVSNTGIYCSSDRVGIVYLVRV